jgi:hypothetical protein
MMEHLISRSPGVTTGLGFTVGGGFRGLTEELDAEVQRAADLIVAEFGIPVTIRFNSDRLYGGAWLMTDRNDRIGVNASVGLNVGLTIVSRLRHLYTQLPDPDETFEDRLRADGIDPENPPETYLTRHVLVTEDWLLDRSLAQDGLSTRPSLRRTVPDLDHGIDLLRTVVKRPLTV